MIRGTLALLMGIATAAGSAGPARAQVTGSYAGSLLVGKPPRPYAAAAALSEDAGVLAGTIVLDSPDPALAGAYLVQGRHKGVRVRMKGLGAGGVRLSVRAKVAGHTLTGRVKLRLAETRTKARLELTQLPGGGDPSSCDAVFVDNESFFTSDVMNGVLVPVCAACHVPGGQAAATRLRVVAGDPAATARTTIAVIDRTAPGDSLLVAKPLARLPHGGGRQLAEGSAAALALEQWAILVAGSDCAGPPTPTTGAELYAAHCAGCHGAGAAGLDGRPDVRCTVQDRIADAVRAGRGTAETGMPAFTAAQLSDAQLALVTDHLAGLCTGLPGDVYASNCATCHGATAGGARNADGVRGPDIRCKDSGDFAEAMRQGEERMPSFPSLVGTARALAQFVHQFCTEG